MGRLCCCHQVASVVSNSVRPYRRQPTRLPRPWDSPGKNTPVGCHFLLQCMKVKSESEVAQWCLTPRDSMDCSLPGSSIHGIFQARVLEWDATAFSGRLCDWIQCNNKDFIRGRERIRIREGNRAKEARQREGEVMMVAGEQSEMWKWKQGLSDAIATPGTERGAPTRECGRPHKAGQGKETDSSLQLPE